MRKMVPCIVFLVVFWTSPVMAMEAELNPASEGLLIASASGFDHLGDVAAIRFTFIVTKGETSVRRSWIWTFQDDMVSYQGAGPDGSDTEYRYGRNDPVTMSDELRTFVDQRFVNDQFWLLFPYHLLWDRNQVTYSFAENRPLPIPPGSLNCLTVTYKPDSGGYTPGDAYNVYYGSDRLIRQWIYRKGNASEPTLVTTWERYATVGPLTLSLLRRNLDLGFTVEFADVAVQRNGESTWISAVPMKNVE